MATGGDIPENLRVFLLKDWQPPARQALKALPIAAALKERRRKLSKSFRGEVLIVPAGHRKIRANDTSYAFRPASDFYYLTALSEPDSVLLLIPRKNAHDQVLFVHPSAGKDSIAFFTDRHRGSLWTGESPSLAELEVTHAIECRPLSELPATLDAAIEEAGGRVRILRGISAPVESMLENHRNNQAADDELATVLSEMRLIKDAAEIEAVKASIAATVRGFEDVIARLKHAKNERELEGVFWTRARMEGNDVGYIPIVASGANACTVHWKRNNGNIRRGELLLLDAGVEGRSLYTADLTRTLPVSGKFTSHQRVIYEIVLNAHRAAIAAVKPGNDFSAPNTAAMKVLAEGLERLGILPGSAEEALRPENQFHRRYTAHGVSHMLGLDVHDCAKARDEKYKYGKFEPGMILTIEPGLYMQPDDLTVPKKYRGIAARIEDNVLVTDKGCRVLSQRLPREPDEIERWIQKVWARSQSR